MTKAFKAGDAVRVARNKGNKTFWTKGLVGKVVGTKPASRYDYGLTLDLVEDVLTLDDPASPPSPHFKAGSQTSTILSHLLRGKTITNAESMLNYGIFRLSDCIHKIRDAGFEVATNVKKDEVGRKYASYALATKQAA